MLLIKGRKQRVISLGQSIVLSKKVRFQVAFVVGLMENVTSLIFYKDINLYLALEFTSLLLLEWLQLLLDLDKRCTSFVTFIQLFSQF